MSKSVIRGFQPERFAAARARSGMKVTDLVRAMRRDADRERAELARSGQQSTRPLRVPSDDTITRWERRVTSPHIDLLRRAVQTLGIEPEEVLVVDPGERFLSDYRHLQMLTQVELAVRAGFSTKVLQEIERADRALTDDACERLAEALHISDSEVRSAYARTQARLPGTPA